MRFYMKLLMLMTAVSVMLLLTFTIKEDDTSVPLESELRRDIGDVTSMDQEDPANVSKDIEQEIAESEKTVESQPHPPDRIWGNYPAWFSRGWNNSKTQDASRAPFVGDKPLFGECHVSNKRKERSPSSDEKTPFIEPKKYLPNSKNPCWYEEGGGSGKTLRCLPYFYVAGVAKCGTTDIYRRLREHPQIFRGTQKEYHYWDRERFGNVEVSEDGSILDIIRDPWTFKEYTDRITGKENIREIEKDLKTKGSSSKLFGDGSPSYLWDILNWMLLEGNQGCREPRSVIGQHIRHIYPDAKIILIFRHPTPRLYSRFLSRIWRTPFLKGATSQTFHDYVKRGVDKYKECFKRRSIRECAYNYTLYDDVTVRLIEGMYPLFMDDWLRIWPREQMLILRSEDYSANVNATLEKTFDFLGVDKLTKEEYDKVMDLRLVNVGKMYDELGPMKEETVKILDQFYQPFVEKFAELLQDRRFLWKDTYTPQLD